LSRILWDEGLFYLQMLSGYGILKKHHRAYKTAQQGDFDDDSLLPPAGTV